jgi:glutamate synthase domain-containing protein 3
MSGGIAYVLDESGIFASERCNPVSVDLEPLIEATDVELVRKLVLKHVALTSSPRARWVLDNWPDIQARFVKVFPKEYKRVLGVPQAVTTYFPVNANSLTQAEAQHG